MSAKSKLKFTLFFVATKNLIGGNMIKLKENFDIELSELLDIDDKFVQILDLFEIDKMKQLIERREDMLAVYLFEAPNTREFEERKQYVLKYFNISTLNRDLRNLLFSKEV